MSCICIVFLKYSEFRQIHFEMLAFESTYRHTYIYIHVNARHACTEAEQAYITKILLSGTAVQDPVHGTA